MSLASAPAISPCIGVCRLHADARVCVGCGRTGDEIASWGNADDAHRSAVLAALPGRLAPLDRAPIRVSRPEQSVHSILRDALGHETTAVLVGSHGAVAEFMAPPSKQPRVQAEGPRLSAFVTGGAVRFERLDNAVIFRTDETANAPLLLAAPAPGLTLPVANGLERLGPDWAPIQPRSGDESAMVFDLGLGHASARFMVRTADPALIAKLDNLSGAALGNVLAEAGPMLVAANPERIVESPLCRIEVTTPIPPPGGQSPRAPHTHLLPGAIALGRALPPGIAVPPGFVPIALIYLEETPR